VPLKHVLEGEVESLLGNVSHNVNQISSPERKKTFFPWDSCEAVDDPFISEFGVCFYLWMAELVL